MYASVHERVRNSRRSIEEVRPAVTTEENADLKEYSAALLQQALEINKDNPHFGTYNFVHMPYAKLQNGSKLQIKLLAVIATCSRLEFCTYDTVTYMDCVACRLHTYDW